MSVPGTFFRDAEDTAAPGAGAGATVRGWARLKKLRSSALLFFAVTDQGVTSVASFLAGIMVARATSPHDFGIYTLVGVAAIWANGAQGGLVTTPYTYQQAHCAPAHRRSYNGSILAHHWSLCAVAAVLVAPLVAVSFSWPHLPALLLPIAIMLVGVLVKEFLRATYCAHHMFGRALGVNSAIVTLQLSGMAALWVTHHLSIGSALLALGLPPILVASPIYRARTWASRFSLHDSLTQLRASWAFGKWLLAGIAVSVFSRDAFPWVLAALRGIDTTGRYAAHLNVALLAKPAVFGLANYIAPSFARTARDDGPTALVRRTRSTAALIGAVLVVYCLAMLLEGGPLSALIYGPRLAASSPVVALIALGLGVTAISLPYGSALLALDRPDINFSASAAGLAVALFVGIPAMGWAGVPGAAVAYLLSALAEHLVRWRALRRLPLVDHRLAGDDA